MKFGFDVEFNPICLLGNAESGSMPATTLKPNERSFEKAAALQPESKAFQALFNSR
jgi:hypothetical protein